MREEISGKRLIKIEDSYHRSHIYMTREYWWMPQGEHLYAENKIDNLNWNANVPLVTTLPEDAKLVFHKTSKFPRHKLGLTTFKRKIKEKGADFMVANFEIPKQDMITKIYPHAWETESEIILTSISNININTLISEFPTLDFKNATYYSDYKMLQVSNEQMFYIEYLCGKYSLPVIKDDDLNKIVDNKQERISVDEVNTLIELAKSMDKENANLALKLFAQFNLSADPTFAWLFLSVYQRYFYGINSVLYTNLKKQFDPYKYVYYGYILTKLKKEPPVDDHEKELITHLLKDYLLVQNLSINTYLEFKNLGYDLNFENNEQTDSY